jgi:tetratricopeptide (TPR) repeat protein
VAIVCSLCVLTALGPSPVSGAPPATRAPEETGDSARAHHEAGRAHVQKRRFEAAIAEYRKAYELRADPSYLLDIAEAYRALGVPERAVFFYRRYLTTHPAPPNRPEIEAQIALLDPGGTTAPAPPLPVHVPMAATALPSRSPDMQLGSSRAVSDGETSVVGRWWFWAAVGALAAAGATVAIVAAGQREETPRTALGNVKIF